MNILIHCPDVVAREAICHHLIECGNHQVMFATTQRLVVSLAIYNPFDLLLLFDPPQGRSLVDLKDYLRQRRRKMRIRLLPDKQGVLMPGWRKVITDALRPRQRPRKEPPLKVHPRFLWKPGK